MNLNLILLMSGGDIFGAVVLGIFVLLMVGVFIVYPIEDNHHQRKRFNGGKCPNCGIELKLEQKGKIHTQYRCPKCMYTAVVDANGNKDTRYCDIFDCWPHLHECEDCASRQCKYYRNEQKSKTKKIPPKKISEDGWPGLV